MAGKVMGRVFSAFGGFLGKMEHRKLAVYAKHANIVQRKVLNTILRKNKRTEYGRKNGFRNIRSVEDYQRIVPLSTYPDYADYIDRMVNGEKNLITAFHISKYAESSGSVGKPKYIPQSVKALWNCQCFSVSAPVGCAVKYYKKHRKRLPPQKGLLTLEITSHKLPCGKTRSCLSGIPLMFLKPLIPFIVTSPREIMFPKNPDKTNMQYLKLRYALPNRDVSYLGTMMTTALENLMRYLEENWEMLCDDIENGTINKSVEVPVDVRGKLEKKLRPNPKRAAELRREFEKGFETPIVARIWPNVGWLYGMGEGSLSVYAKKLRRYTGNLPMHYVGYGASEALMAVPIELDSSDFVMLPHNGFYEFLPVDSPETRPLTIGELEVGKDYEVILTNLSGLYRYRIEDVVRVTGYYKESPTVTFMYRLNQVVNITGEKTSQQMVDWAVEQTAKCFGAEVTGHTIYADVESNPGHYVLFIEPTDYISASERGDFANLFDKYLSESNILFPYWKNAGTLGDTEVHFLHQGTYLEYRESQKRNGANLNQIKPIRVINSESSREFFINHIDSYSLLLKHG